MEGSEEAVQKAVQQIDGFVANVKSVSCEVPYDKCLWGFLQNRQHQYNESENLSLSLFPANNCIKLELSAIGELQLYELHAKLQSLSNAKVKQMVLDKQAFSMVQSKKQSLEDDYDVFVLVQPQQTKSTLLLPAGTLLNGFS